MRRSIAIVAVIGLTACATPDLSEDLGLMSETLDDATAPMRTNLQKTIAAEENRRIASYIADGQQPIKLAPGCNLSRAATAPATPEEITSGRYDCAMLIRRDPADGKTNAELRADLLLVVTGYLSALQALSASTTSDDIRTSTASLLGSAQKLVYLAEPGSTNFGDILGKSPSSISALTGFAAERAKHAWIRRIVTEADPAFQDAVTTILAAIVDSRNDAYVTNLDRLLAAEVAANQASKSQRPHRIASLRQAFAAVEASKKSSNYYAIQSLGRAHTLLVGRVRRNVTLEEINGFIAEINEIALIAK